MDRPNYTMDYVDGEYRIVTKPPYTTAYVWDNFGLGDYRVEVDAQQAPGGQRGAVGLVFGLGEYGYYLFAVNDGYFALLRQAHAAPAPVTVIGWTSSPAIHPGSALNRLRVIREYGHMALYVNDQLLGESSDTNFNGHGFGIAAATFDDVNFEGRFDNFEVYAGACLNPPATGGGLTESAPFDTVIMQHGSTTR